VKSLSYTFRYNDLAHLEASLGPDVACVIMEPVVFQEPEPGYLAGVRRLCDQAGALLVFDEMWTGFRLAAGGAQEFYGVRADLATYSKAIANGMPISVLAGRRDVMNLCDQDVFFFTTFGGEALSLAAARATIAEIREKNVPAFLARQGAVLKREFAALTAKLDMEWTRVIGPDCRSLVTFDASAGNPLEMKSFVQQEMFRHGVLWNGFHNMSFSHGDAELEHVVRAYAEVLPRLRDAVARGAVRDMLRGEPVAPVFRRTDNFNVRPRA
jgi:glutamate-1-semialdehyde 2,1-aminomutase